MENYTEKPPLHGRLHPLLGLLSILLIAFGFYIIASLLSMGLAFALFNIDSVDIQQLISGEAINDTTRNALFLIQGITALAAFLLAPFVYLIVIEQKKPSILFSSNRLTFLAVVLTIVITISFMPVNSVIAEWNMDFNFPDFMESWARSQEDAAKSATEALTNVTSPAYFLISFLVIAIIPALGEELLFRGIIQNKLWEASNIHVAIWVTGILFGVIHMQFYGVIPRILLGVIFGYLYYWSGTLWIPILAHFINNGFTLFVLYLNNIGELSYDIESQEVPLSMVLPFAIIFLAAIIYFKRYMDQKKYEGLA